MSLLASRSRQSPLLLAVDGGDSKTDIVVADREGQLLGAHRVAMSSHAGLDRAGAPVALEAAIRSTVKRFGLDRDHQRLADVGVFCLAGADLPVDERRIHAALSRRHLTGRTLVRNDTMAVLRAGTDRGWGVAVVCGSGMNAFGRGPDGTVVRFPAFGEVSGDLAAGGGWIGKMALAHAVRAEDGRGDRTVLQHRVPKFFGMRSAAAVTEALYLGKLASHRLVELSPLVFEAAGDRDRVARAILDRVADEVVAFATASIKRLRIANRDVEIVLGGGIFRAEDGSFHRRIHSGVHRTAPRAVIRRLTAPPVVGAALLGLDAFHASPEAVLRLRRALTYRRLG